MSRSNLGTINPDTTSGDQLALDLTAFENAQNSLHSNGTGVRPTYAIAKTIWVSDSTNPWVVYMYDGANDIAIGTVNTITGKFVPGTNAATAFGDIKQLATTSATGVVELAEQSEVNEGTTDNVVTSEVLAFSPATPQLSSETLTTSGTIKGYAGLPAWLKRITIIFNEVSVSGTSIPMIQLGVFGSFETTGYLGSASGISTSVTTTNHNTGFLVSDVNAAANTYSGSITLFLQDATTNVWSVEGGLGLSDIPKTTVVRGSKSLPSELTQIRLTTVNGTDTFDAGAINIIYG